VTGINCGEGCTCTISRPIQSSAMAVPRTHAPRIRFELLRPRRPCARWHSVRVALPRGPVAAAAVGHPRRGTALPGRPGSCGDGQRPAMISTFHHDGPELHSHSAWPLSDPRFLTTCDEKENGHVRIWNIANLQQPFRYRRSGPRRPATASTTSTSTAATATAPGTTRGSRSSTSRTLPIPCGRANTSIRPDGAAVLRTPAAIRPMGRRPPAGDLLHGPLLPSGSSSHRRSAAGFWSAASSRKQAAWRPAIRGRRPPGVAARRWPRRAHRLDTRGAGGDPARSRSSPRAVIGYGDSGPWTKGSAGRSSSAGWR